MACQLMDIRTVVTVPEPLSAWHELRDAQLVTGDNPVLTAALDAVEGQLRALGIDDPQAEIDRLHREAHELGVEHSHASVRSMVLVKR